MNKNTYKDLIVWQKGTEVAICVYKITENFPQREMYGLASQMRRAAISVPSNIAEGKLRDHALEWRRFLLIAYGSGGELETQLEIAKRLGYIDEKGDNYKDLMGGLSEVMKILNTMIGKAGSPKAYRLAPGA